MYRGSVRWGWSRRTLASELGCGRTGRRRPNVLSALPDDATVGETVSAQLEIVGEEAFDGPRLRRDGVWAVAFAADWCPFCADFLSRFARTAARHPNLLIANVTSEESPLWERFHIEVVPTVIVFADGQPQDRFDGVSGVGLTEEAVDAIAAALKPRRAGPARSALFHRGG